MTLIELRTLSIDFRRTSSNLLNATDDNADVLLLRFKKYIDETSFVAKIVHDATQDIEYDFHDCFKSEHGSWMDIVPPCDEGCHIKAQYDYIDDICTNGSVLGQAVNYYCSSNNCVDIIRHFLCDAFKPLIDFINDAISKEMMLQEEATRSESASMKQVFNAPVYGSVNQAHGDIQSANTTVVNDIETIAKLIDEILPAIEAADLEAEEKESLIDDLETVKEETCKESPKGVRLKKALSGISSFLKNGATIISSSVILAEKMPILIHSIQQFIENLPR